MNGITHTLFTSLWQGLISCYLTDQIRSNSDFMLLPPDQSTL
jgi:hypothetical protein